MPTCPRCNQPIDDRAINCPHCNHQLKAFGHPGIPLHQSTDNTFLCDRCTYDKDDSCNFPQRPHAQSCTLFHDYTTPLVPEVFTVPSQQGWSGIKHRLYQYRVVIAIAIIMTMSVILALSSK